MVGAMVIAGCAGGAAWALIPALLRAFFRTNEIPTATFSESRPHSIVPHRR